MYFSKELHGAYWFSYLNAIEYYLNFWKLASVLTAVRIKLRAALFRVYTVWIVFDCIITFAVNFYICDYTSPYKMPWQKSIEFPSSRVSRVSSLLLAFGEVLVPQDQPVLLQGSPPPPPPPPPTVWIRMGSFFPKFRREDTLVPSVFVLQASMRITGRRRSRYAQDIG